MALTVRKRSTDAGSGDYSISGVGISKGGYESPGIALSAAIIASEAARRDGAGEGTVYVYDGDETIVGRVERAKDGSSNIYGAAYIAAARKGAA